MTMSGTNHPNNNKKLCVLLLKTVRYSFLSYTVPSMLLDPVSTVYYYKNNIKLLMMIK